MDRGGIELGEFDLNVSSELSKERSDVNPEELLVEEEEEPCITIPIGHSPNEENNEEETQRENKELDDDDNSVTMEAVSDPEGQLKEGDGSNLSEVDNSKSKDSVTVERGNVAVMNISDARDFVETESWGGNEEGNESSSGSEAPTM